MSTVSVAELLEERLRALGVSRTYGLALAGLPHVAVDDPDLAVLLADVDGRLGHHDGSGRLGAALLSGPILHLSSEPGGRAPMQTIGSAEELLDALVDPPGITIPGTLALHLDLDLSARVDAQLAASVTPDRQPVVTLDPSMAELDVVAVVGPGVVRAGAVDDLEAFSRKGGVGVINTWGAKGVERWDSPFHFGTAGLQRRDFELAGVPGADVVVASGLDPAEARPDQLGSLVVQEVPPRQLAALCHRWPASRTPPVRPPLYSALSEVVVPMYESESVPLSAPRAALHLSGALPERGVAVADPGPAGFWIARTFPTSFPGSVCVPATRTEGFAAAAALVCQLEGRPYVAVVDQPADGELDPTTAAIVELATAVGQPVSLQLWGPGGRLDGVGDHVDLLQRRLGTPGAHLDLVPVAVDDTDEIEAVAGPIVAW
jgi:hypothetical protein